MKQRTKTIVITGGAGFIGSALVRFILRKTDFDVVNIDKLTYSGSLKNLAEYANNPRHHFVCEDICNENAIQQVLHQYQPCGIIHLAAESHVDNSILAADCFIQTNVVGTYTLLKTALAYYQTLNQTVQQNFRFLHVSTDEVFGSLKDNDKPFTENSPYQPNNPYAASKASADCLVRAWHQTYKLPTIISHCCNNYGEYQYPEKLIALAIKNALSHQNIPIYGNGLQIRDWIYVEDHVRALWLIFQKGNIGENYIISNEDSCNNLQLINTICEILDEIKPQKNSQSYRQYIQHVPDRLGHDIRYASNATKLRQQLNWTAQTNFTQGLRKTVKWYVDNLK